MHATRSTFLFYQLYNLEYFTKLYTKLRNRRNIGAENIKKRELENYAKHNPEFAAKLKLLEELKSQKENEQKSSKENS